MTLEDIRVQFTAADRAEALACARAIIRHAANVGMEDRFGKPSIHSHYIGALGEIAFARYLERPWKCREYVAGALDVGRYEVRTYSMSDSYFYVKAKPNDAEDTRIASVCIRAGRDAEGELSNEADAIIVGWITVRSVRKLGKRKDPGKRGAPAHFIYDHRLLETVGW